jgi:hypothetical protein
MVANDICLKANITKVNAISFELGIPRGNTKLYYKIERSPNDPPMYWVWDTRPP